MISELAVALKYAFEKTKKVDYKKVL